LEIILIQGMAIDYEVRGSSVFLLFGRFITIRGLGIPKPCVSI